VRAAIDTYAQGDQIIAEELSRVSQRAPVATAATRLLSEASAAGIGQLGLSALSELLSDPPAGSD
jgi:hypothetical protein